MDIIASVKAEFKKRFKSEPIIIVAPGRINLIGEHTDYNNGFVMPAAIDKHLVFAISPTHDHLCNIYSIDFNEGVTFSFDDLHPGEVWVNYLMGVMDAFQRRGLKVKGVDCVFGGTIPVGGGLSSSAALCSGFGFALNEIYSCGLNRLELARISQSTEHNFAGAKVGIMDPYASLFGMKNSVMLLDCRDQTHEYFPFHFPDYDVVLIDSRVKHSLASSEYNNRRASCEEGVEIIKQQNPKVNSLRDVSLELLISMKDKMSADTFLKCLYVVEEIERTQKAAGYLKAGNLPAFGELMYQTHEGLSQLYEVSCSELDFLATWAKDNRNSIVGARMMGGGFGGCTINLIKKEATIALTDEVKAKYFATFKTEPHFYSVKLEDGVHLTSTL